MAVPGLFLRGALQDRFEPLSIHTMLVLIQEPHTEALRRPARSKVSRTTGMTEKRQDLTQMLRSGANETDLLSAVYDELKVLAKSRMSRERSDHTLQATALVHEAYMKLARDQEVEWRERGHFFGAAAEAMRRILIDHARRAKSEKRGSGVPCVTLGAAEALVQLGPEQALAIDDALTTLEAEDPQAAEITRLRFFAGLTMEETAQALGVSERSVYREWSYARARLFELLGDENGVS